MGGPHRWFLAMSSGPHKAVTLWSAEESFMVGFICVQYTAAALEEFKNTGSSRLAPTTCLRGTAQRLRGKCRVCILY